MKRCYRYLFGIILLFLCMTMHKADVFAVEDRTTYVSVEKFSLGQGYLVTPKKVTVKEGTMVSEIVEQLLNEAGYQPAIDNPFTPEWYLAGIPDADNGNTRVPVSVMKLECYPFDSQYFNGMIPGSENTSYPDLEQFSYQVEANSKGFPNSTGWYYYVNNIAPSDGMGKYQVEDQDIIRVQFTLCMGDLALVSNIDEATKGLAVIGEYLKKEQVDSQLLNVRDKALAILSDIDAPKEIVEDLQGTLQVISQDLSDGRKDEDYDTIVEEVSVLFDKVKANDVVCRIGQLPNKAALKDQEWINDIYSMYRALTSGQATWVDKESKKKLDTLLTGLEQLKKEAERKKYTPVRAKITKIISKKKQAKLTWKRIAGVSGYEIQMSRKKSSGFKKIATIKKAKTVTYTKKKLKSKKIMYFRVRAYRKVGRTTYYGAYSAVKKVKIK